MVREIFKHMKGKVFYPLCGTDVIWGECTRHDCDYIVFGDDDRKCLESVKDYIKENGVKGECIRLDFDHLPFIKGSFQTVIYKPGAGVTIGLKKDVPILKEVIDPQILVAVKTVECKHSPQGPITKRFVDNFSKKNGYALKERFEPQIEEDLPPMNFPPTDVLVFEKY